MHVNKAAIHMSTCTMSNTVSINMSLLIIRRWMSRLKSTNNSKNRYMGVYKRYIYISNNCLFVYMYIYIFMPICAYVYIFNIHIYPHLNPHLSIPPHGCNVFCWRLIYDATWADPQFDEGLGPNERGGEAISFGPVPWYLEPRVGPRWRPVVGWFAGFERTKDWVFLTKNGWNGWILGWNFGAFFFSKQNMFWLYPLILVNYSKFRWMGKMGDP